MQKRFKVLLLLLLITSSLSAQTQIRNIGLFFANINEEKNDNILKIIYIIHKTEAFYSDNKDINISSVKEKVDLYNIKQIINYSFSNGLDGTFYLKIEGQVLTVTLYNSIGDQKALKRFYTSDTINESEWFNFFNESIKNLKTTNIISTPVEKKRQFIHDFPYINLCLTGVSYKSFYDERENSFSPYPVIISINTYPFRYFEFGLFFNFDSQNIEYKLVDSATKKTSFQKANYTIAYGFNTGLSFFYEKYHYSLGVMMYNFHYNFNKYNQFDSVEKYFLPQFSLYLKTDIKLIKFINYSSFIHIKTLPALSHKNGNISAPLFNYESVILDFSLLGFSITF